jgi:TrmH family RNA methyltransferase
MPAAITSLENPKVRLLRSLHRRRRRYSERLFLLEGVRLVEEAFRAGVVPTLALYLPERLEQTPRGRALLERLSALEMAFPTTPAILDAIADTVTPQGVVAAAPLPEPPPRPDGLILILDQVRDPGNCGTILRTAEAAGAQRVLCAPGTVDPFEPKAVRAGMGAHFHLPIRLASWDEIVAACQGLQVLLAEVQGGCPYDQVDWRLPTALIVGGEAEGASHEAKRLASALVSIPMAGSADSLNVTVATGILLFEALRQRRAAYPQVPGTTRDG